MYDSLTMKPFVKFGFIVCLFGVITSCSRSKQMESPLDYVNPLLGTEFFGHTFPGASLPYAMIHPSPDTHNQGWTYCSGYLYNDTNIMGFSHTRFSGTGMASGGDILLMPIVNQTLQVWPGSKENPDEGYRSRFSHDREKASPGYYSVHLDDYNVQVELTTSPRVAFHRYTFPKSNYSRVVLDLGHQIGSMVPRRESEFTILNDSTIEGFRSAQMGDIYFVIHFSKPFRYYGTFDSGYKTPESGASLFPYKSGERGTHIGAFLEYKTDSLEQIMVKVAISYTGIEGARKNMAAEIPHWNFDQTHIDARKIWEKALSVVAIEDTCQGNKEKFYTAVYRSLLAQYISQDVDGAYYGMNGEVATATGSNHLGSFSCWDTYRSQHPLLTIIAPEHQSDVLTSIQDKIRDFGWLPAQHFQNVFGEAMVGDHLIPVIVDAYMKGYRDYDVESVYEAMRKKAMELPSPPVPINAARSGLSYYMMMGYTPVDKVNESVPNTLELAYDDWCIAQMAKALGKVSDYTYFMRRANNYTNLWDSTTLFMRPKYSTGKFMEAVSEKNRQVIMKSGDHTWYGFFDPLLVGRRPNRYFTESNAWQYVWSVQHDIPGLINLFGGKEPFCSKLDTFFTMDPNISGPKYVGVVGTIGQYVHGNQPSHHVAYLYNYGGQPWKSQYWSRFICRNLYRTGPGGLCGNEDMGSLSSWYVLSGMGFYPVTPGSTMYLIGSPSFGKSTIQVPGGKTFEIVAHNNNESNVYIQSATLNGAPFDQTWIDHNQIMQGGRLEFTMGSEPNKQWGLTPIPELK